MKSITPGEKESEGNERKQNKKRFLPMMRE
jgi:hypothetical protein